MNPDYLVRGVDGNATNVHYRCDVRLHGVSDHQYLFWSKIVLRCQFQIILLILVREFDTFF